MDALLLDAPIELSIEACALGMGHSSSNAAVKVVTIKLKKEECALGMGRKGNDAAA